MHVLCYTLSGFGMVLKPRLMYNINIYIYIYIYIHTHTHTNMICEERKIIGAR